MISLIGIPSAYVDETVSPSVESFLLGTDCPVIFAFQRNDGTIDSFEETASPSGFTKITMSGTYELNDGDEISVYDEDSDTMLSATVTADLGSDVFELDLVWSEDYNLTYIINETQYQYYFLEIRLKVNGTYLVNSIRFTPSTKGYLEADVSAYLRSEVTGDKVGAYINDMDVETEQSGYFTVEYRERYSGDSNTYTEEGNTWYYIYATRTKEQGSNLIEYNYTETIEGDFVNEYEELTWYIGTPLDIQFWWNPDFDALDGTIKIYDAGNNLLDTITTTLDTEGIGYLCSIRLNQDTIDDDADYMTIEVTEHVGSP